jgi:hypothetical protein
MGAIVPLALLALAALAGAWAWIGPRWQGNWVAASLTSRMFLACGAILLLSTALLIVLAKALWHAGAAERRSCKGDASSQGGAAIVEFALVLPILLMLVLIMAQSSLLMAGNLCVNYAAFCAARSAIVTVPWNATLSWPPPVVADAPNFLSDSKLNRVKMAAVWAVLPVSCGDKSYPAADFAALGGGLDRFFSQYGNQAPAWVNRSLPQRLQYALDHTNVMIEPPLAAVANGEYGDHEDLVVHVEHTLYLAVPYAGRLFWQFSGADGRELDNPAGQYGVVVRTTCRLPNEGVRDWVDREVFDDLNMGP